MCFLEKFCRCQTSWKKYKNKTKFPNKYIPKEQETVRGKSEIEMSNEPKKSLSLKNKTTQELIQRWDMLRYIGLTFFKFTTIVTLKSDHRDGFHILL